MKSAKTENGKEPIAIIGIGCRYPGAANVQELWQNLMAGKDSIGPYPGGRFPGVDRAYASAGKPGCVGTNEGGFLQEIDAFDSQFFELSPRETVYVDPQHRLLLEVGWDALEDAGLVRADYEGSRTSVFVGLWTSEYETRLYESGSEPDFYSVTGCGRASASGRVSYAFGLEGASVTVDSACSSSLVAVQLACESLWREESEMALAGGANLILGGEITELFTRAGMLSPDGRCKFGDVRANGFVRSDGAGMVVLKPLSRARADGDRIYALIRGGAVNNDGRTSGLLVTPSRPGQRQMLESAWQAAEIDPSGLRYLEAHGTGTAIGDPVELGAITDALTAAGVRERCVLGSIKSNIGHTEAAAGVAGLIKTALVLHHRMIPPSLHCETLNPKIAWDEAPIRMAREAVDLRDEPGPLLAGVSAFGITGTNAHLVLEEAEAQTERKPEAERARVLTISAQTPQALQELVNGYRRQVEAGSESLEDLCYTATLRRNHHEFRTALVGSNRAELREALEAAVHGEAADAVVTGRAGATAPRVVFVAPGQGSQWPGMARELYEQEPAFRAAFDACDRAIEKETGWSLRERLLSDDAEEFLKQIDVIQPALFAMSVALAAVWRAWGVEPDAVVGHSMGEVAAAHLAGVLSLEDAAAVICRRSRLMKTLRTEAGVVGGMATVDLSLQETEALLASKPGLSVAASNGPSTTVISGDLAGLEELLRALEAREVYCRLVKVDVASHSPQVDPILDALREELAEIQPRPAKIPMLSTVTGGYAETADQPGTRMDAAYWVRNLRQCVLLAPAVQQLAEGGHSVFVELSPHPILLPSVESSARKAVGQVTAIASLRREKPARATMLAGLAALYTTGYPVGWERLLDEGGRCVRLPQYPFQRERCWPEPAQGKRWAEEQGGHPLLGMRFTSARQPQTVVWESRIGIGVLPYLTDHRVLRSAVFPASAYVDMALSAVRALRPEERFALVDAAFRNAAYLPEEGSRIFQLAMTPEGAEGFTFEVRSRADEDGDAWTLHATGKLQRASGQERKRSVSVAELEAMCPEMRDRETHYSQLAESGLQYGPAFRLVEAARTGNGRSVCRLGGVRDDQGTSVLHPALLDAGFQSMAHVRPMGDGFHAGDTYLPVSIQRVQVYRDVQSGERLVAAAELASRDGRTGSFRVNLRLLSEAGEVIAEITEMEAQRVAQQEGAEPRSWLYPVRWVAEPPLREPSGLPRLREESWIVFADGCGVGDAIAEMLTLGGGTCTRVRPGKAFTQTGEHEYTVRPEVRG
ncbi:MAG: type I polyketide synthase, partial [Acidobacteriaceae bacterium]